MIPMASLREVIERPLSSDAALKASRSGISYELALVPTTLVW
jgi:hypothetical protein